GPVGPAASQDAALHDGAQELALGGRGRVGHRQPDGRDDARDGFGGGGFGGAGLVTGGLVRGGLRAGGRGAGGGVVVASLGDHARDVVDGATTLGGPPHAHAHPGAHGVGAVRGQGQEHGG